MPLSLESNFGLSPPIEILKELVYITQVVGVFCYKLSKAPYQDFSNLIYLYFKRGAKISPASAILWP